MSNYTKATNFAAKDSLTKGDPLKIVKGTEIDAEFTAIATAVNSKPDAANTYSKAEVDAATGLLLPKAGGTLTDFLTLHAAPTSDLHASTKKYVDDAKSDVQNEVKHAFCGAGGSPVAGGWYQDAGSTLAFPEKYDSGTVYNPTTGVFTAPVNGVYCFNGGFSVASNSPSTVITVIIAVDGTAVSAASSSGPSYAYAGCSYIGALSAGQQVTLKSGFSFDGANYFANNGSFTGHILWRT